MKIFASIFSIHFIFLLLCNCSNPKTETSPNIIYQNQLQSLQSIPFGDSNYFDTCYFIKPEADSNSFIVEITQMEIFDNKIFIWDRQTEKVSVFNFTGKHLTNFGQKGRAPKEYSSLSGFCIHPHDSTIQLFDPLMGSVKKYSLKGEYINSIKHTNKDLCFINKAQMLNSDKMFCYYSSNWEGNYVFSVIDISDYNQQEPILTYPYQSSKGRSYTLSNQPYVLFNNTITYIKPFSNTIYTYADQESKPYFTLQNKKDINYALLKNRLKENDGNYYKVTQNLLSENLYNSGFLNIFENNRFLLIDFMTPLSMPQAILWDKKKKDGVHIQNYSTHYPELQLFKTSHENSVICVWNRDAIEALKKDISSLKKHNYPEIVKKTIDQFNEEKDNPILIFFHLKNK